MLIQISWLWKLGTKTSPDSNLQKFKSKGHLVKLVATSDKLETITSWLCWKSDGWCQCSQYTPVYTVRFNLVHPSNVYLSSLCLLYPFANAVTHGMRRMTAIGNSRCGSFQTLGCGRKATLKRSWWDNVVQHLVTCRHLLFVRVIPMLLLHADRTPPLLPTVLKVSEKYIFASFLLWFWWLVSF